LGDIRRLLEGRKAAENLDDDDDDDAPTGEGTQTERCAQCEKAEVAMASLIILVVVWGEMKEGV
jgi:hypothetical protein